MKKQNEGKRVERAKGKETGVFTEQSSEASEESVVVVDHRVTKDGVEYLVKGTQEPDSDRMWIPRPRTCSGIHKTAEGFSLHKEVNGTPHASFTCTL